MGFVISAAIFVLLALIAIVAGIFAPKSYTSTYGSSYNSSTEEKRTNAGLIGGVAAAVFLIIAGLIFIPAGINDVPVRSVGVPVTFGKAGAPLNPGFHWEMPWTSVNSISERVQTDNYNQNSNTPSYTGTCITIRLGGAQEGCADTSISWQVIPAGASALYLDYGSSNDVMQQVQDNLIYKNLRTALNTVVGDYNPITDALTSANSGTSQFSTFDPQIVALLDKQVGSYVKIVSFDLQYIHYSPATQAKLDSIQQVEAQKQIETEQVAVNTEIALANKALVSQTGTLTPSQLQGECFSIVQKAETDNYALPASFGNCLGGTASSVIVDSSK